MERDLRAAPLTDVRCGSVVSALRGAFPNFTVELGDGSSIAAGAVVVATGFTPFNPTSLKEYGYGAYPNVITATELEWMLNPRGPTGGRLVRPSNGKDAERLAIVFCVGSRNKRIGASFSSRICCSYSTSRRAQSWSAIPRHWWLASTWMFAPTIEISKRCTRWHQSGASATSGAASPCAASCQTRLFPSARKRVLNRPFSGEFDLVSLSTGMRPCEGANELARCLGITCGPDGFFLCGNGSSIRMMRPVTAFFSRDARPA